MKIIVWFIRILFFICLFVFWKELLFPILEMNLTALTLLDLTKAAFYSFGIFITVKWFINSTC